MAAIPPLLQILDLGFEGPSSNIAAFELLAQRGVFLLKNAVRLDQVGHNDFKPLEIVLGGVEELGSRRFGDRLLARCFPSRSSTFGREAPVAMRPPKPDTRPLYHEPAGLGARIPGSENLFSRRRRGGRPERQAQGDPGARSPNQVGAFPRELRTCRRESPIKYPSTARAASRPSAMAQTTRDWPRRQSPAAKIPGWLVA